MQRLSLSAKCAVVTGGANGIGLAIAQRLEDLGANVAVIDRDETGLRVAADNHLSARAVILPGDVSKVESVDALIGNAAEALGGLHILINNAGISEALVPTVQQDEQEWQRVIDVNLRGTYLMCRGFARRVLGKTDNSAIVNIASVVGLAGFPASNAYGPSKAAVVHMTKSMACEWSRRGIRVNCVAPGFVDAPMAHVMFSSGVDQVRTVNRIPMRRLGQAAEIANVVGFLVSDDASYITGATIPVDGGWSAYGGI